MTSNRIFSQDRLERAEMLTVEGGEFETPNITAKLDKPTDQSLFTQFECGVCGFGSTSIILVNAHKLSTITCRIFPMFARVGPKSIWEPMNVSEEKRTVEKAQLDRCKTPTRREPKRLVKTKTEVENSKSIAERRPQGIVGYFCDALDYIISRSAYRQNLNDNTKNQAEPNTQKDMITVRTQYSIEEKSTRHRLWSSIFDRKHCYIIVENVNEFGFHVRDDPTQWNHRIYIVDLRVGTADQADQSSAKYFYKQNVGHYAQKASRLPILPPYPKEIVGPHIQVTCRSSTH
ncbi:hypothetical protein EDC01DRAFT_634162 [Geopyxis carbonaria]|nr:hypothetical protein EDC01DRAFT_634162 [Geopyxis carbonaria]